MTHTWAGQSWPDIEMGECPDSGDEQPIIVYDDGSMECYHCGVGVDSL